MTSVVIRYMLSQNKDLSSARKLQFYNKLLPPMLAAQQTSTLGDTPQMYEFYMVQTLVAPTVQGTESILLVFLLFDISSVLLSFFPQ